jgi:hypothetical protein
MSLRRRSLLTVQALLTFVFLGAAAYTFFGSPFQSDLLSVQPLPLDEAPQALRLTVNETGIAAITTRDLRNTNLPFPELSSETLHLSRDGDTVPFYVHGDGDDATLYFFARAITDSLKTPAVYWLAPGRGRSMSQRDRSPDGPGLSQGVRWNHWEENSNFQLMATGDDHWLGANVYAPDSLEIPLADIQPSGGPGELTVRVWSSNQSPANPDHHLQILLNDEQLATHFWDGIKQETLTLPIAPGILRNQDNRLILNVPGDTGAAGESIYLDWLSLEYEGQLDLGQGQLHFRSNAQNVRVFGAGEEPLAFDVSDPDAPVLLINTEIEDDSVTFAGNGPGSTYLVLNPRDAIRPTISPVPEREQPLKSAERGADYLAIVPESQGFEERLQPLLEYRRQQGLRVVTVPLQQIYDEFAHGRQTPRAIREFIHYTLSVWQSPAPRFILLVGDATYDVNDYTGGRNKNLIPTNLVFDDHAGHVASDTSYTIFGGNIPHPDLAIGRFPVQNARQLEVIVDKTLTYERGASSSWLSRVLLVADDEPRFNDSSDWLAETLETRGYAPQRLYMTENEDIHDAIISALNHGVSIVNYVGHGGIEVWGDEAVLRTEDAPRLRNGSRLPILTTFTCLNGFFHHPDVDALAETLLWTRGGGIVAAVAPSGRTYSSQQMPLSNAFYNQLLSSEAPTVGHALLQAKLTIARDPSLRNVVHTVNLLGDPALGFRSP